MNSSIFFSGECRKVTFWRHVGVAKGKPCNRILVRGLLRAMNNGTVTDTLVEITNAKILLSSRDLSFDGDHLRLKEPLPAGNYYLNIEITYSDMEPARYERW